MKILFIASSESDYLQDLTYAGLSEILGNKSLVDFPYHWQYHKEKKFFWNKKLEYPKNLGLVKEMNSSTLHLTEEEVLNYLKQNKFSLVILGSAKIDNLAILDRLMEVIQVPWIFIDGGDWTEVGGDFKRLGGQESFNLFQKICRLKKPSVIFKRELPLESKEEKLFPLPFSVNSSIIPIKPPVDNKKYQVQFWAV